MKLVYSNTRRKDSTFFSHEFVLVASRKTVIKEGYTYDDVIDWNRFLADSLELIDFLRQHFNGVIGDEHDNITCGFMEGTEFRISIDDETDANIAMLLKLTYC